MGKLWFGMVIFASLMVGAGFQMLLDEQIGDDGPSWKAIAQGAEAENDTLFTMNYRLRAANDSLLADNDTLFVRLVTALIAEQHWRRLAASKDRQPEGRQFWRDFDFDWLTPLAPYPADSVFTVPL